MDPICHTLVGACLGRTGLERRTAWGLATLVVAANLPDIDVIAIPLGYNLAFRRGWTHGVLALAVWPWVLAAVMAGVHRLVRRGAATPARFCELVLLAAIGVATHPFLDYLNVYGMRWLMPFVDRWYYADTLFIVEPWLWLVLGAGVVLSARRWRRGVPRAGAPARAALALSAMYIGVMMTGAVTTRMSIIRSVGPEARLMAAPVPLDPFARRVVVDDGGTYRIGRYRLLSGDSLLLDTVVERRADPAWVAAIARTPAGRGFLQWARFPAFTSVPTAAGTVIRAFDLRYASPEGDGWASFEAPLIAPPP